MDNGGLSASDVALMTGANNGNWDGGWGSGMMWIFALLILAGGGLNWGNNANGNLASSNEVQRGFDTQNQMANQREILSAVTNGTAQSVAATNQSFHDSLAVLNDKYTELQRDIGNIALGQANAIASQKECCCDTLRAIDNVVYQGALNTANINQNVSQQMQKILDAIQGNRMADMQNQINQLQLQQAVQGVVRYPMQTTYNSGCNPFCGCS